MRKPTKAQRKKDAWIKDTQMFQRIASNSDDCDSYETLASEYDKHLKG